MKYHFLFFSLLTIGLVCLSETKKSVVYYVSPTEPLSSCPGNSSCPPGQLCHTMDYLVEHSSEFFSPDHVNVTLIFMCGVHNYTKNLTVQNLHLFVMKGAAESKEKVIINMLLQVTYPHTKFGTSLGKPKCTTIDFHNVTFVNITTMTMRCPSIHLKGGLITLKNSNLHGYTGIKEVLSSIAITGRDSHALLDNCTFSENCFIVSDTSAGINVSNSTFRSYRHVAKSIIVAYSSFIRLTGYVNFTNSTVGVLPKIVSSGTALFLQTTHRELNPSLSIATDAKVYFVNLTSTRDGGAVYMKNGSLNIGAKATVVFAYNKAAYRGGAVCLMSGSSMNIGVESSVVFTNNSVWPNSWGGGAVYILGGALNINTNASVSFIKNSAHVFKGGAMCCINGAFNISPDANINFSYNSARSGGAIYMHKMTLFVGTTALLFYNNTAILGGALFFNYATLYIEDNCTANFSMNSAQLQGGGVYIRETTNHSIIVDNFATVLFLNNSAYQGGALYLVPLSFTIEIRYQSSVQFINNTTSDVGGAVYSGLQTGAPCIFMVTNDSSEISFIGNSAKCGVGHHMYGTSARDHKCDQEHINLANKQGKPYCLENDENGSHINISFHPGLDETLSPVSSTPWRVCLCDSNGKPQCVNLQQIFTSVSMYRGETFTLSACAVGYDFGTTVGIVHAGFLHSNPSSRLEESQHSQPVSNGEKCSTVKYTIHSKQDEEHLLLQTSGLPAAAYVVNNTFEFDGYKSKIDAEILNYKTHDQFGCIDEDLLTTPVFVNVTLLPGCPPGLTLNNNHTTCSCYSILANNGFKCLIRNKTSYLKWSNTVWVNATFIEYQSNGIIYNHFCPPHYCRLGKKAINIGDDPSKQCASNRTGILCGACTENFSLAIGSSRCIECPNSHNMVLLLAFTAAGVFLVFFILALNLTVTQGLINGLIFYTNIAWAYKILLFPSEIQENQLLTFLQVFVAWLNLDFGIESCFFVGLDIYWKTWLQFLFPFYIWAIAGVIIVACRYSSRLTNLIGSRAVPLLATLFLLSYMKLLRTIIDAASVAAIAQFPQNTSYVVWYLDGNLRYCQHPHIYLFLAAVATLVFLWLPYTLLLLFIQPLRRVSHLRPLKWINKLAPVYDAYFSPLKDKHRYWFGTMLLVRGILLVILTATSASNPELNVFSLFLSIAFLFCFISVKHVYKRMTVRVLESSTLLNLIILSAGTLYKWESTKKRSMLLIASLGFAFVQFCVIVVWSLIKPCFSADLKCRQKQTTDVIAEDIDDDITHERIEDPELEPLIIHAASNYNAPKATY